MEDLEGLHRYATTMLREKLVLKKLRIDRVLLLNHYVLRLLADV